MNCFAARHDRAASTTDAIGTDPSTAPAADRFPPQSRVACSLVLRRRGLQCGLWLDLLFLKARSAEHRPALRRLKGHRGFCATLRASCARLGSDPLRAPRALGFALLAVLRIVLKLFIVKEYLLARCKNELCAAVYTFENSISEIHGRLPPTGNNTENGFGFSSPLPVPVPRSFSSRATRARSAPKF
jgi:hypothetical protein